MCVCVCVCEDISSVDAQCRELSRGVLCVFGYE